VDFGGVERQNVLSIVIEINAWPRSRRGRATDDAVGAIERVPGKSPTEIESADGFPGRVNVLLGNRRPALLGQHLDGTAPRYSLDNDATSLHTAFLCCLGESSFE